METGGGAGGAGSQEKRGGAGGGGADSQEKRGGVRYITEELLLRLSGCPSLALVRSLNLSSAGNKHIQVIENLHSCQRLQVLNLNHNWIQRMDRLNALTQLRELQLAYNRIQRIEGLELMSSLQHLNLSHNRIDHVPVWLTKKLHSLHTLHLQHNLITSLYELSRLRSLSSLSELSVSGNPASSLPHSRLFLLFHVRTLDRLDDLSITPDERAHAHQRFSVEELERLQREVDSSQSELSRLQTEQLAAETRLQRQEETNRALTAHTETQRRAHTLLQQELHTKTQLLEQTTAELTRSFHRLYELEQELTFYKIDAKLSPLPFCSAQEVDCVDSAAESPYVGRARHIRNAITSAPRRGSDAHTDVETPRPLLEHGSTEQSKAHHSEQQLAAEHLSPEESSTDTQEALLSRLLRKHSVLEQLRGEADLTQRHMDGQTDESRETERETEELETLDPTDPRHAHVIARLSVWRRRLDRMSGKQSELEGRLDDMLSRIAMETQEIKELEQQLTDGQILVNESLQKDLEDIIGGLQQYVRDLRQQAQQQVHSLQLHLEDTQQHCRQLEDAAKTHRQDMSVQQEELSLLRMEAQALRDRQVELEAELTQQVTVRQLECDALQAAVDKEKQSREIRESQLQSTIDTLQDDKSSLQQTVQTLQVQLDRTRTRYKDSRTLLDQTRVQLDQITAAMLDPQEVQSGPEELDQDQFSPEHMLSRSVEQLFRAVRQTATSRDQHQQHRHHSQEQVAGLQAQPEERVTRSRDRDQDQDQEQGPDWRLKEQDRDQEQDREPDWRLKEQDRDQDQDCEQDREPDWRLKDQDQDQDCEQDREPDWRLKEQLERLRLRLQRSQSRNRRVQHKLEAKLEQSALQLQEVEQQRDELQQQRDELQQQRDELQLQRDELRQQRDELQQQRDELQLQRDELRLQRDELRLQRDELRQQRDELRQQLRSQSDAHQRKLRQLSRSMCNADQLTAEQLTTTTDQLRALNHRVESAVEQIDSSSDRRSEHAHTHTHTHTYAVEELQAELEKAQRHTHRLRQKLDRVRTRTRTRTRTRSGEGGQWCFIPPGHSDPSLGSVGTQDSGLGLGLGLHHLSSPERGQPPTGGGYWVYMPPTHADTAEWRDSGGGSDGDRSSRGRSPPPAAPAPAAAASAGLSDAHTPLAAPAWLLCAALHCNVPEHTHKQGDKCVCECVHKESERLKEEKKKLRLETKQLRHTLRQHRSVMQVCDEVECVEKTLLKRRAELRRADRLLLEAQSCTHTTRDKQENLELRRLKTEEILLKQRLNSLFTHTA